MAIVKSGLRASRNNSQSQTQSSSSTDDELQLKENYTYDSGAESDTSDISDIAEVGSELCMVGDQTCSVPYELFDLPDLKQILSLDTWNTCLTEEERYNLSAYLPDMDQQTFRLTLKELLSGEEINFGSPLSELFNRLKGGLCPPEVSRYREGLQYLQMKEHYHLLRTYHNNMVSGFLEMQKFWKNCPPGAGVEERLRVWNTRKNNKNLPQAEQQSCHPYLMQKSEPSRKGKPRRPPVQPNKKGKIASNQNGTEVVYLPSQEKSLTTTKVDGKGVLKVKTLTKGPPESSNGRVESKEIQKIEKRTPKGVLKIVPKGLLKRHEQPEMAQVQRGIASFSEMQGFETQVRPSGFPRAMSGWEGDAFIGEASFTQLKSRGTKKKSTLEMPENAAWVQGLELSNKNALQGKNSSGYDTKMNRVKEQAILNNMSAPGPGWFGQDTRHFDEEGNLAGGKRKDFPEMRYARLGGMFHEDGSYDEEQWRHLDKQNRGYRRSPVEQYRLPGEPYHGLGDHQAMNFHQQPWSFEKQTNSNYRELNLKGPGIVCGDQNDVQKVLERSKKKHREIKQPSEELLRLSDEQKSTAEQYREKPEECLEEPSHFMENRRLLVDSSGLLNDSKWSDEGRMLKEQKKRKQSQMDYVTTLDLEKKQEELMALEGQKNGLELLKKHKRKKDYERTEAEEILPPYSVRTDYDAKALDGFDKPKSVKIKIKKPKENAKILDAWTESNGLQDGALS